VPPTQKGKGSAPSTHKSVRNAAALLSCGNALSGLAQAQRRNITIQVKQAQFRRVSLSAGEQPWSPTEVAAGQI
jgi:hypothetical protein